MSSVPAELVNRRSFRPSFYFWIALVMAAYVFGGFSLAALQRYLTNAPTVMPPVVHLHGITFISWMTLVVAQTWLINVKNVALHRSLGTFGIALGTTAPFTGMLIVALSMGNGRAERAALLLRSKLPLAGGARRLRCSVHARDASHARPGQPPVASFCSR